MWEPLQGIGEVGSSLPSTRGFSEHTCFHFSDAYRLFTNKNNSSENTKPQKSSSPSPTPASTFWPKVNDFKPQAQPSPPSWGARSSHAESPVWEAWVERCLHPAVHRRISSSELSYVPFFVWSGHLCSPPIALSSQGPGSDVGGKRKVET